MVFPQTNLGAKVWLKINGTWVDSTRYDAQTRVLADDTITITRGKASAQDRTPASTATWTWLDPNGVYNNENPRSPYYGLLPRNTPVRISIPRPNTSFNMTFASNIISSGISTPDKAALQITGDIDIRAEIEPRQWTRFGGSSTLTNSMLIASKYGTNTANGSWYFRLMDTGQLSIVWTPTGTGVFTVSSTVPVPTQTPRMAVRVQLQVNNGSGGYTVTFATAPSINGTYTTLGTAIVTTAFTTSFNNNVGTPVELGTLGGIGVQTSASQTDFIGRFYAFQLRNGLGGTVVANADFTALANGTTSFADSVPNTWTVSGPSAEITNSDYRFHGELSSLTVDPQMTADGVGKDVRVHAEAGGLIRRLTQNATPLQSNLLRQYSSLAPSGYWPGEDQSGAGQSGTSTYGSVASGITTGQPAVTQDITFAGYDSTLPGSAGVMTLGGTGPLFDGYANGYLGTPGQFHFMAWFKFPSIPLSQQTLFSIFGNGTVKRFDIAVSATEYLVKGYDSTGTLIVDKHTTFGTNADPTNWVGFHLSVTQSGGNVIPAVDWVTWNGLPYTIYSNYGMGAAGTLSYAGTCGAFTRVRVQGVAALSGVKVAHPVVTSSAIDNSGTTYISAGTANYGELGDVRFKRLNAETMGIYYTYTGRAFDTRLMGPQAIAQFMDNLYDIVDVDAGMMYEERDQLVLGYRSRNSMLNQNADLLLSYTSKQLSDNLKSVPDDTGVANDITMNRRNGSSARATQTTGPMSIQAPPNGIGSVPDSPTINNFSDSELPYYAQFRLGVSSWPEARYPQIKVSLHRQQFTWGGSLSLAVLNAREGSRMGIKDLPQFLPAEPLSLLIQGTSEVLGTNTIDITFNCTPYGPYRIGYLNSSITGQEVFKANSTVDTTGTVQTQLAAAVTSTATSLSIKTLSGPLLATSAAEPNSFPADIFIGGERITVTAVTGTTSPQTATVTRSVNGIVKAQVINAPVTVAQAFNTTL